MGKYRLRGTWRTTSTAVCEMWHTLCTPLREAICVTCPLLTVSAAQQSYCQGIARYSTFTAESVLSVGFSIDCVALRVIGVLCTMMHATYVARCRSPADCLVSHVTVTVDTSHAVRVRPLSTQSVHVLRIFDRCGIHIVCITYWTVSLSSAPPGRSARPPPC